MSLQRLTQIGVPIGIVMIVVMLVVPLPAVVLDMLIAANIAGALLVLLTAMSVTRPLDFAAFPALLLVMTLFRLALNVSATRLVLLDGYAGKVIETFGHFVVGGSLIVGLIIFVILLIIQFVVITKGAERVAEVGARFTLDAMPGKQMAIDADLNSGLIDEDEARRRRQEVHAEADFYGAMDGASKFVKGDAIAAILITVVNLIGGMAIGLAQLGMSPGDAVSTYSLLTVGDGLVSQIPALLLSVATGLVVTRSAAESDMGTDIVKQITGNKNALQIAGFGAMALCLIPGLPKIPFLLVGGVMLLFSARAGREEPAAVEATDQVAELPAADHPEQLAEEIRATGAMIKFITDGDVAGAIMAARPDTGVDMLLGIGGTPEGIITACAMKSMGGVIQGRLWPTDDEERQRAVDAGHDLDAVLDTDTLVTGDDCFFVATGITDGELLEGVRYSANSVSTHSLVMRSRSGTIRTIRSEHKLSKLRAYSAVDFDR